MVTYGDPTGLLHQPGHNSGYEPSNPHQNDPSEAVEPPRPEYPQSVIDAGVMKDDPQTRKNRVRAYLIAPPGGERYKPKYNQTHLAFCYEFPEDAMCGEQSAPSPGDVAHGLLDLCGFVLDLCDGLNAIVYLAEGDGVNAALSSAAMVPLVGSVATGAKVARKACSFSGDTQVLMADGTAKPIEEIQVGDRVQAANPITGETGARTVAAVWYHQDDVFEFRVEGGNAVATTEDHPFWNATDHEWQQAQQFDQGDWLFTAHRQPLRVAGLNLLAVRAVTAYNLTVSDLHTYYVLIADAPVLVHNSDCINWAVNSVKTWGHTFKQHGAGAKNLRSLMDRTRGTGTDQGQWLDNDAAAEFLRGVHTPNAAPSAAFSVRLPRGMGQVIRPDGTLVEAPYALIVPSGNGLFKTAYPYLGR